MKREKKFLTSWIKYRDNAASSFIHNSCRYGACSLMLFLINCNYSSTWRKGSWRCGRVTSRVHWYGKRAEYQIRLISPFQRDGTAWTRSRDQVKSRNPQSRSNGSSLWSIFARHAFESWWAEQLPIRIQAWSMISQSTSALNNLRIFRMNGFIASLNL